MFSLTDQSDTSGAWQCLDSYSDYTVVTHDLSSVLPNAPDTENNCNLLDDQTSIYIGNSRLTTKTQFTRLFKTMDANGQDVDLKPGLPVAF